MNSTGATGKEIAVLAGPALVDALRLVGIRRTRVIDPGAETAGEVRAAIRDWMAGGEVGVIVIGGEFAAHARDLLDGHREGRRLLPVILELPSSGTTPEDAAAYYRRLCRIFLGLEIELKQEAEQQTGVPGRWESP